MTGPVKLVAFAAALAVAFAVGFGAGEVAGPFDTGTSQHPPAMQHEGGQR